MEGFAKDSKFVICMVGKPARGKTYISNKIRRYLQWLGFKAQTFNIDYRKAMYGGIPPEFFDHQNSENSKKRDECAKEALDDMIKFLKENNGDTAIYDGTNVTKVQRLAVKQFVEQQIPESYVMWIETICNDETIILQNIKNAKIHSPDYQDVKEEEAIKDYIKRIEMYTNVYEELDENEYPNISFVKLINIGTEVIINNIFGYLQSKILSYVMNLQIHPRPIYLTICGESEYNALHKVGGDSSLTEKGVKYAKLLNKFLQDEMCKYWQTDEFKKELQEEYKEENKDDSNELQLKTESSIQQQKKKVKILTSSMKRSIETGTFINLGYEPISLKVLDEINYGITDSLAYDEIRKQYPFEDSERNSNKLKYRYPRGESYIDVINRIEPVIFEIEKSRGPVVVIAHKAVIRCMYVYFANQNIDKTPFYFVPQNAVIKLTPETYFCREERFLFNLDNEEIKHEIVTQANVIDPKTFTGLQQSLNKQE